MGNYRFRFSNIIPNSWFYTSGNKLNNKITKTQLITTSSSSSSSVSSVPSSQQAIDKRKSYYFTRELRVPDPTTRIQDPSPPDTPQPNPRRKSLKKKKPVTPKKPIRRKLVSSELNPAAGCSCRMMDSVSSESVLTTDSVSSDNEVIWPKGPEKQLSCSCKMNLLNDEVYSKVDLQPIITKPAKEEFGSGKWAIDGGSRSLSVRVVKEGIIGISPTQTRSPVRRVRGNGYSPRLGNRVRVNGINGGRRRNGNRRSLSESMAVLKTSMDPGRDFKESMVEMIMQNNIRSSKDLEDLLACYLALNSDEYHDLIIKVFKQIWFESTDIRL